MRKVLSFLALVCICIGVSDAAVRTTNSNNRGTQSVQSRQTTKNSQSRSTHGSPRTVTPRTTSAAQRTTVSRNTTTNTARTSVSSRNATTSPRGTTTSARSAQTVTRQAARTAIKSPSRLSRAATVSQTFGAGYNSCRDAYFTCMDQFCATADDSYRRCVCSSRLNEIKQKQRALGDAADQIQNFKDLNLEAIPKTAAEVNAMLTASNGEYAASIKKDTSDSAKKLAGINAVLTNVKSKSLSTSGTLDIAGDINAIWATTDLASGANIANLTGETLYNAVHSQCADLVANHCESKSTLNMVISAYGMYIENDCTLLSNALDKKKNDANATIRETEHEMHNARLENYNAHNSTSINDCVAKVRKDITAETACGTDYVHCLDTSGLYLNKITGEPIYTANFYQLETMVSLTGDILTNQTNRMLVTELNRKRSFAENSLSTCQDLADDVWDEFMRQAITEIYQGQQTRIRQVKDECLDVVNKCYDAQTQSLRDFSNTKEQLLLGSQLELSEQLCKEKLDACSNLYGGGSDGLQELVATMYNITNQKIAQNCLTTLQEYATSLCSVPANDTLHSYPYACRVYAPGEQKYAMLWKCQNQTQNKNKITSPDSSDSGDEETPENPLHGENSCVSRGAPIIRPQRINNESGGYFCRDQRIYTSCKEGFYLSTCDIDPCNLTNGSVEPGNFCKPCPNDAECAGGTACPKHKFTSCDPGYYLSDCDGKDKNKLENTDLTPGNQCALCPNGKQCTGGMKCPADPATNEDDDQSNFDQTLCGDDYVGSLYQKIVRYALQACERPSKTSTNGLETPISQSVLQDVNATMDAVRVSMSTSLQAECERLGGYWVTTQYEEKQNESDPTTGKNIKLYDRFYSETGANKQWGYCADFDAAKDYYGTEKLSGSSNNSLKPAQASVTPVVEGDENSDENDNGEP